LSATSKLAPPRINLTDILNHQQREGIASPPPYPGVAELDEMPLLQMANSEAYRVSDLCVDAATRKMGIFATKLAKQRNASYAQNHYNEHRPYPALM
jgi:hypothetical protein